MDDIHDIRELIVVLPFWKEYLPEIFVTLGSLTLVYLLYTAFKKDKEPKPVEVKVDHEATFRDAKKQIEEAHKNLNQYKDKELAISLTNTIRYYIESEYNINAPEETTEEFLENAKNHPSLKGELLDLMTQFLELCDSAKYAVTEFTSDNQEKAFALANQIVDRINKERIKERKRLSELEKQARLLAERNPHTHIPFTKK